MQIFPGWRRVLRAMLPLKRGNFDESMAEKARGNDAHAKEMLDAFLAEFGKYEFEIERYFDQGLAGGAFKVLLKSSPDFVFEV